MTMSGEHNHPEYALAETVDLTSIRLSTLEAWVVAHDAASPAPEPEPEPEPEPDPDPELPPVEPELATLLVSISPDRSEPIPLAGATLSGGVFVYLDGGGDGPVTFYVNGLEVRTEVEAPFDLGGGSVEVANPTTFEAGSVDVEAVDADGEPLATATFTYEDPDPDPEPPPVIIIDEEYPANPDVILSAGDAINPALGTAGRIVELLNGFYGDQSTFSPATGVYLFCRGVAEVKTTPGTKRLVDTGGNDVTLRGLKVDGYGLNTHQSDAALRLPSGSSGWHLWRIEVLRSVNNALGFRGSNHLTTDLVLHDCARYGWAGGTDSTMTRTKVYRMCVDDGSQLVTRAPDSNRGVCKMAGGSSGMFIDGLDYWVIQGGKGLWWDGARDGRGRNIVGRDISHNAVSVEVCWGGAKNAPPGKTTTWPDPAFVIEDVQVQDQHNEDIFNSVWPAPAGVIASMSPGVMVDGIVVDGSGGAAIGVLYSAKHSVFQDGYIAQKISAEWAKAELKNNKVFFENFTIEGTQKRYSCGVVGGFDAEYAPQFHRGAGGSYGTKDRFRWEGNSDMTLDEWLALGLHS